MRLKQHAASSDLILFDLATDRRGVVPIIGTGGYVSYTGELGRSRLLQQVPHSARIEFQSDKHFALFQRAATKLKDLLVSLDTFDRATVLHFPMTDTAVDGAEVPKLRGVTADQWNDTYRRYYGLLVELGFNMLSLPADLALTTSQHKWGPEQNHFIDDAYLWWADRLEEFIRPTTARSL